MIDKMKDTSPANTEIVPTVPFLRLDDIDAPDKVNNFNYEIENRESPRFNDISIKKSLA